METQSMRRALTLLKKMTLQTSSEHARGSCAVVRFAMQNLAAWQQAWCSTSKLLNNKIKQLVPP